jgi:hypothetical protein
MMGDIIRFMAANVSLDPQVGFVGFADQVGQRYFWMQSGETSTAKHEVWLERDDQAWGGHGGAWSVILSREKFIVNARELPWMMCESIEIVFAIDDATYSRLKELLQQVMVSCPTNLDIRD